MARGKSSRGRQSGGGSKGKYRSAISGRYVTAKHGKRSPRTTVKESASKGGEQQGQETPVGHHGPLRDRGYRQAPPEHYCHGKVASVERRMEVIQPMVKKFSKAKINAARARAGSAERKANSALRKAKSSLRKAR